ncbi:hypothetical protein ST47_g8720 [Ascochyta rabiei]|uniref:Uncharacterized protein n=1 Tax=Didymella rabiei TaxID=5454 RepID=A0A162YPL4_DIDRA|nr:hypothetical protein ST47_g8720 [Ascochyta rabiei]
MVKFLGPEYRVSPPLHVQCISNAPLDDRLSALRAALAAGADPNELGGWKNPGTCRPLHYAIDDSAQHDYRQLKLNFPVVEALLEAGADPRLPDLRPGRRSPIQELEGWFEAYESGHAGWCAEDLEMCPFYEKALRAMKKVAKELDGMLKRLVSDYGIFC